MTEKKKTIETTKKRLQINNRMGGMKMWFAVMSVYFLLFFGIGWIAFTDMDFNDPKNTVKKYLDILYEYQTEVKKTTKAGAPDTAEEEIFKQTMQELMKKADESAGDLQELASQSFNIVLGAFLAFLSATATMLFQGSKKKEGPKPGKFDKENVK